MLIIPVLCLAILLIWVWLLCDTLRFERDLIWLFAVAIIPPIGIPAYILNFFVLGDEQRGLGAMQRRAAENQRLAFLVASAEDGSIVAHDLERSQILINREEFEQALQILKPILDGDDQDLSAHFMAAKALLGLKRTDQALAHLDYVYSQDSSFHGWTAAMAYARELHRSGRNDAAGLVYETLMDRNGIAEVVVGYAEYLIGLGRMPEARKHLEILLAHYRDDPAYHERRDGKWIKIARKLASE